MLKISCAKCGRIFSADVEHIGKSLRCSGCGDAVPIEGVVRQAGVSPTVRAASMPSVRFGANRPSLRFPSLKIGRSMQKASFIALATVVCVVCVYFVAQPKVAMNRRRVPDAVKAADSRADSIVTLSPDDFETSPDNIATPSYGRQISPATGTNLIQSGVPPALPGRQ
jgi:DNA-directed RNA polymerase subunit RPC12/RpoP